MFGFNKEKLYLGQFSNLVLQSILKSKASDSLPDDGVLTEKEIKKFKEELLFLRVELLMVQLMEIGKFGKKKFSNEEIGKTVGIALGLALRDTGVSKSESDRIMDSMVEHVGFYEDYLAEIDSAELKKTGVYFNVLRCFTELVLGKDGKRVTTEEGRDKDFTVFSYGKQIYQADTEAFKQMYKSISFLD